MSLVEEALGVVWGRKKELLRLVTARFELARACAHWEARSDLKSNALDQLGHVTVDQG